MTLQGARAEARRCLLCHDAPCSTACPAGTDPGRFLRQVRFDNLAGAARTVLDNNPLGGICGAVCPVSRLCEQACARCALESPVRIGAMQEFVHRWGVEHGVSAPPLADACGKRVAVVGAGPSGLAAARELARRGAQVVVFEAQARAGGMLRYGIAPHRLDDARIDQEVGRIEALGVEFRYDAPVEGEQGLGALLAQGFDAVYVATGLQAGRALSVEGADHAAVVTAIEFLSSANTGGAEGAAARLVRDKDLVVVGGGSVAMDVACTARELGARRIYALSLESLAELPADRDEVVAAQRRHVAFVPQTRVTRIEAEGGALRGVHTIQTDWKEPGSLAPANAVDRPGTEARVRADAVVFAVSQTLDARGIRLLTTLDHHADGRVVTRDETRTSQRAVHAGGDVVRGGDTVVRAVADGKQAAARILPGIEAPPRPALPSLETEFCGVRFPNPFCLSSSPVSNSAEMCARALEAGWGGVYYKTLGIESKHRVYHPSPRLHALHHEGVRVIGLQNVEQITDRPLKDNLADIEALRTRFPDRAIGVSIMGFSEEDWSELARAAEGAGAQILELNFSCPQMATETAGHRIGQNADLLTRYTAAAKRACSVPVLAKMTPNITDMVPVALAAKRGGADGISAINTLKSISAVDLVARTPMPTIRGRSAISGFSGPADRPIALRFIAEMALAPELGIPLSGMGGIVTWRDAAEFLLLGASNLQITTAVMHHGYRIIDDLTEGLRDYMLTCGVSRVAELVGGALDKLVDPADLDHTTEAVSVIDAERCVRCGQCYVACQDAANQAISLDEARLPIIDEERCVGCLMCRHVCPVDECVTYKVRPRIARS